MWPGMKGDTFYFPTAEGVYLRNNQGSYVIKGKGIARILDILVPHLDGQHTLAEISRNIPPQFRESVARIVDLLVTKGFAKDLTHDIPYNLSQRELRAYEAEIAFIDPFTDSATSHFEQYRYSNVLLLGSGLTLTALVHAHLHSGLFQINVLVTDECDTDRQRHQEFLSLYQERDGRQRIITVDPPDWNDEAAIKRLLVPFDAVVHISDRPMVARTQLLNRFCMEQAKPLIQATIIGDHAWIGPLVQKEKPGCWECAWHRLQANFTPSDADPAAYEFRDGISAPVSSCLAAPTAAVVANITSFELFKYLTGAGPLETNEYLLHINLETLRRSRHHFLPHPLCQHLHLEPFYPLPCSGTWSGN